VLGLPFAWHENRCRSGVKKTCVIRLDKGGILCYIDSMMYDFGNEPKQDWTITFNDGSTANYYQMTAYEAIRI
tara:strand:+ start:495 stop:713 length:219 start_codon:yes stop_codon:yes gene_type:complete